MFYTNNVIIVVMSDYKTYIMSDYKTYIIKSTLSINELFDALKESGERLGLNIYQYNNVLHYLSKLVDKHPETMLMLLYLIKQADELGVSDKINLEEGDFVSECLKAQKKLRDSTDTKRDVA